MNNESNVRSAEFWVGHTIVLVATVLGVYLAAIAGLKQAVQFELVKSDRDTYYLANSLYEETLSNVIIIRQLAEAKKDGGSFSIRKETPEYNKFLWESMKFADSTFEVPPNVLNGIQRYYQDVNTVIDHMGRYWQNVSKDAKKLLALCDELEKNELAALKAQTAQLKENLAEYGISP